MSLRSSLSSRLRLPDLGTSRALRPATVHAGRPVGQDAGRLVYIGGGRNDPQCRPSHFFNPFFYLCESDAVANDLYGKWLADRADIDFFLQPLLGVALLCDCDRGLGCHSHVLRRVLDQFTLSQETVSPTMGVLMPLSLLCRRRCPGPRNPLRYQAGKLAMRVMTLELRPRLSHRCRSRMTSLALTKPDEVPLWN